MLAACGGDDSHKQDAISDIEEAIAVVDEYVCTNEYEQALAYAYGSESVPMGWDGTPFIVDVSSTFPNADDLLDVVAKEADRIHAVLGYEVFVAGGVLPFADIVVLDRSHFPPSQHIEVRYSDAPAIAANNRTIRSDAPAIAIPNNRLILSNAERLYDPFESISTEFWSRQGIIHEIYHLLGFVHIANSPGVVMSRSLMFGPGGGPAGDLPCSNCNPAESTPLDLAKLACIYD
jgi:hypothetical protein